MSYVLGLDLGTSSLKGVLVNEKGVVIGEATFSYELLQPKVGYIEQKPLDWIEAVDRVFQKLSSTILDFQEKLVGVSFSGQMHSLVLLDREERLLRAAILWNDTRTGEQCKKIKHQFGEKLLSISKNIAIEGFTLPKILWIKENEPDIWEKVRHIMLPKDYLGYYFTSHFYTDYSDAAGTLLLDEENGVWSNEVCNQFDIPISYLPKIVSSTEYIGNIKQELKERYGLEQNVKVFSGGADNACAAIGAGVLSEDTALVSIGTSGVFLTYEGSCLPNYEGKLHLFSHVMKNKYYSMGVTLAAGESLKWFKETFAPNVSFEYLLGAASNVSVGSEGLLFAPYIMGERTPYIDSAIRGSFIGIDHHHAFAHFTRAVLEGITFSLKDSQVLLKKVTQKEIEKIISVGGGAKNNVWLQMQADIFGTKIMRLSVEQGPGFGAAIIAAVGNGWYKNLESCIYDWVKYDSKIFYPKEENVSK